ncbi:MAG: hypothetical protein ACJASV_001743 [Pseudorhodobacter sp.]|jgi:hypothetical protein
MLAGHAITLWFLASGMACILLLAWASVAGLGADRHRALAFTLLLLTAALAAMPIGLNSLRGSTSFPFGTTLFIGASLSLAAAIAILWKLRRVPGLQRCSDFGIASCLNLLIALWVALSPLSAY